MSTRSITLPNITFKRGLSTQEVGFPDSSPEKESGWISNVAPECWPSSMVASPFSKRTIQLGASPNSKLEEEEGWVSNAAPECWPSSTGGSPLSKRMVRFSIEDSRQKTPKAISRVALPPIHCRSKTQNP